MHLTSTESYTKNYKYLWQFAIRQVLNNLRDKKNKRKSFLISIAALKDYEDDIDVYKIIIPYRIFHPASRIKGA